jgi:dipeptidyl aminopeptidase/acylaminoacyl peptidase
MLHELRLGDKNAPAINPPRLQGHTPGSATRLWVYLPKQKAKAPRSLPCVLIAPAGSNLLAGMPLVEDDRPEHLPYVRAGFAVIAFDLEGYGAEFAIAGQQRLQGPGLARVVRSSGLVSNLTSFLQASAGLANGRVALAYASTKVQAIDPSRLYVAGHSSAGTFALLFAENEPRIKACLAYAPVIDLAQRLDPRAKPLIRSVAGNGFMERYSPRAMESSLKCPVFLFASEDDGDSLDDARACSRRLKQAGKDVTVEKAETGGHYDSMIEHGIPRGREWLKKLDSSRGGADRR